MCQSFVSRLTKFEALLLKGYLQIPLLTPNVRLGGVGLALPS